MRTCGVRQFLLFETLTLDELVAEADARERAAKRATRCVLRRLAY